MKQFLATMMLLAALGLAIVPLSSTPRQAQINGIGTAIGASEVRLALPQFQPASGDANTVRLTALFNQVLHDDLDFSGNIALVNPSFYPLARVKGPSDIQADDWKKPGVNAQYIDFGNATIKNGELYLESYLWDLGVTTNRELLANGLHSQVLTDDAVRMTAHRYSDLIVNTLFGGKTGIAQTKIAYVATTSARTVNKETTKEIYVMDYDGANPLPLTTYHSTSITPNWAPDGDRIAFTTYRTGVPNIEILSWLDRRSYPFPAIGGTTTTPAWSPDGSQIAFATSKDGYDGTEIYVSDWNGRNMKRLTVSKLTDISPSWNPKTGRDIAFVSERSGSQQIYTMDVQGTNVQRIITEGGDTENPAWSPDGGSIAFCWKKPGNSHFDIYIHDLARGINSQLTSTDSGDNERPSWSPDGRHLVFVSTRTGTSQIFTMLANGMKVRQLTRNGKSEGPAWSGFIGK